MDKKEIGIFIARLRKEKNMTQKELANILGVTNRAVSKWETGEGYPDITLFPIIAEIFEITTDELLTGKLELKDTKEVKRTHLEEFFYQNSIIRYRNQYLIALIVVIVGVMLAIYILSQYRGIYTTFIYAEMITLSTFLIASRVYYISFKALNEIKSKYSLESDSHHEQNKRSAYFDQLLFCVFALMSFIMMVLVIPMYQYLCYGYYNVYRRIIGKFDIPDGKLAIDFTFAIVFIGLVYLILLTISAWVIRKRGNK